MNEQEQFWYDHVTRQQVSSFGLRFWDDRYYSQSFMVGLTLIFIDSKL